MEVYNASGKTKTPDLRITKPCGALVFKTDKPLLDIKNEAITIEVERTDGNNESIAVNIPLRDVLLLTTHGQTHIDASNGGMLALCEIAGNGSIELEENASIRVSMTGLSHNHNYEIHGLEYPVDRTEAVIFDKKVMNTDETNREFYLDDSDLVLIDGAESIKQIQIKYDNGEIVKRSLTELRALQHDLDPIIAMGKGSPAVSDPTDPIPVTPDVFIYP